MKTFYAKLGIIFLTVFLFLSFNKSAFADYLTTPYLGQKVLLILFDTDRSLLCEKPEVAFERAHENGSDVLLDNMTNCVTIENYIYYMNIFTKKFLKRVLITSGPELGTSGWVRADAVNPSGTDGLEYFNSGEYVAVLRNGQAVRGDVMKQDKRGISLNVFDGANDIYLRNELIAQVYPIKDANKGD